ncbi:hypothetical protein ACU4I5_05760 [Ensifer adhaerens]
MSSRADGLAKRIYEEVTGLDYDKTVKPAELPPAKNSIEFLNRRRSIKYGFAKDNADA